MPVIRHRPVCLRLDSLSFSTVARERFPLVVFSFWLTSPTVDNFQSRLSLAVMIDLRSMNGNIFSFQRITYADMIKQFPSKRCNHFLALNVQFARLEHRQQNGDKVKMKKECQ